MGRHFRTAVAQAELEDRERPGAYHRVALPPRRRRARCIDRDHPARAARRLRRAGRPPRRRALPAAVRHHRDHAAVRRRGARSSPTTLADPEKGTGIAMICTFGDLTDVTWWRELQLPTRPIIGWDGRLVRRRPGVASTDRAGRDGLRRARRHDGLHAPRSAMVELLRESGDLVGEPAADHAPGEVLREGRQPLEIVTTRQWYIRNGGRDAELRERAARARRASSHWHPAYMRVRYENWVERPQRRLADLAASGSSACRSRSGTRSTPTASRVYDAPDRCPTRPRCRSTRPPTCPPATTSDQRGAARRLHRRPRRDGHLGHLVADPADRRRLGARPRPVRAHLPDGPAPAGPRHHPHLAVLHRRARPPRARLRCRGRTRRSPAGSSTPTARRCRSRRATSSRPMDLLEEHGSDAVRYWAASGRPGTDTAFDVGQMKVGRRLAIKMLNASKFVARRSARRRGRAARSPSRSTARCSRGSADVVDEATAAFEDYDYTRALERTETFFWRSATTTSSWSRTAPTASTGEAGAASANAALRHGAVGAAAAVRAVPAVRHRGGVVVVAGRLGAPGRRGRPPPTPCAVAGDGDPALLGDVAAVLTGVRKAKSRGEGLDERRRRPRPKSPSRSPPTIAWRGLWTTWPRPRAPSRWP